MLVQLLFNHFKKNGEVTKVSIYKDDLMCLHFAFKKFKFQHSRKEIYQLIAFK